MAKPLLSERGVSALAKIVTGDSKISPYRSGPELVSFFNELGFNDIYGNGFPSRWMYAEAKIRDFADFDQLKLCIRNAFDPRDWFEYHLPRDEAAHYLDDYFKFEGFEIVADGDFLTVAKRSDGAVSFHFPNTSTQQVNRQFIEEQVSKCDHKVAQQDFDGAITNARTLIEAVLMDVELELSSTPPPPYDGELLKLYKRVQKLLCLEPTRTDISGVLKQVLSGLVSIVSGIAGSRNKMSDAHARTYRPARRHAELVVNSAKTLATFIAATKDHRLKQKTNQQP